MAENYYYPYGKIASAIRSRNLQIQFSEQPPEDLRKSNFFNFIVEMRSTSEPVHIEDAQFVEFLHENENDTRNGIKYRLRLRYAGGIEENRYIFLTLVDAATLEPIRYEGHDDSRKMQRVLLTHEAICTRCSQKKSCGNKSEAPSDPRITQTGGLQFYLKCNQNCLKGAGNPRDMRRFALALSFEDITLNKCIVALSNKIFVHNNSKHSRKRKKDVDIKPHLQSCEPVPVEPIVDVTDVTCIYPKVGLVKSSFSFNSKKWSRSGVAFRCADMNLEVTSIIYNVAMTVQLPHHLGPGKLYITLCLNDIPVFTFPYDILDKIYDSSRRMNGFLILCNDDKNNDYKISHGPDDIIACVISAQSCRYYNSPFGPGPYNYGGPSTNYPYGSSPVSPEVHYSSEDSPPSTRHHHHHSPPSYLPPGY